MRLSEIITIYLAVAAPFGVAHFQRRPAADAHARAGLLLIAAASVGLAWPLAALSFLVRRRALHRDFASAAEEAAGARRRESRIEQAGRSVFDSLLRVEEFLEKARGREEETRHALFAARESVERFAGLTMAAAGAELNATPTPRELELCRVSGRTGEDLLLSGRCLHRRNVIRLRLQRERARTEMLHALAEMRERAGDVPLLLPAQREAARRLAEAVIDSYSHAIDLLSLLDDPTAATRVARLLDAECARLRKLGIGPARDDPGTTIGVETCTTLKADQPSVIRALRSTTHTSRSSG